VASIQERKAKDGSTHFRVQIRKKGFETISETFKRKTDAKKWASHTETEMDQGRYFKTAEAKKHALGEAIDRYIELVLPTKPKSMKAQTRQLLWWKSTIGLYSLADITPVKISECRDKLLRDKTNFGKQRQPATVVRYMAVLSHLFTVAKNEWGWLEENPCLKVKKPKEPRGRVKFLSDVERELFLSYCRESTCEMLYPIVILALATGMRRGEIMNMKWTDIDAERGRVLLEETKNGERRAVPLSRNILEVLYAYKNLTVGGDSGLLFPGRNKNKPRDIRKPWCQAVEKANLVDFRFHDLRHSAASYLAMNGATLPEIAEILGHKTLQMVQRYTHLSDSHTSQVIESMNAKLFDA